MRLIIIYFIILIPLLIGSVQAEDWSAFELEKIKQFSLKSSLALDPSNKYLHSLEAIQFGKTLFNEPRLSSNQNVSCSRCHIEERGFTDNKTVAVGVRSGLRNSPTLLNVAEHNWFFWDGSKDSLWAQALSSIENPAEHNFSRVQMLHFIANNPSYREKYQVVFNHLLPKKSVLDAFPEKAGPNAKLSQLIAWKQLSKDQKKIVNRVFTNIGKAIAAYVATIKSKPSRFDQYANELMVKGESKLLKESEREGLKLFLSQQSGCSNCHSGSLFSNKMFHNIGTGIRALDNGRSEVVDAVIIDEFNCLGEYSDASPDQCMELKYVNRNKHELAGAYKTPSLRNLSMTAPYMHDGRFNTLDEVLKYYASIDANKALEVDLAPIKLNKKEQANIVSFLLTL